MIDDNISVFTKLLYNSDKHETIAFPTVSAQPQSAYNGLPIFSNAFPWLFPGGVGDLDRNNMEIPGYVSKWVKTMCLYYDGRFARDPTFCFYALNYKQRLQNSKSAKFFINGFITTNKPSDLESLKDELTRGNHSFIEKLIHYSAKIRGSNSFWKSKKFEVFSWINRLVELQLGPPTMFITLSCAEHFWPDIKRLLLDKCDKMDDDKKPTLTTRSDFAKAIKEYGMVIEEFFIQKVDHWLNHYAKHVFGVNHYFVRFEFTEGRGEIHAHILCAANNLDVYDRAYKCDDKVAKVKIFEEYATEVLGLTATHPATDDQGCLIQDLVVAPEGSLSNESFKNSSMAATTIRMVEVSNDQVDKINLANAVQTHVCGDYCLRMKHDGHRYCRAGCGKEITEGSNNTRGFTLKDEAVLICDSNTNSCSKLQLKRNTTRMVQSSMKLLQIWRANCDIQLLMYDTDPRNPDMYELNKVTDYVVSYACKGNTSTEAEIEVMSSLICT